MMLIVSVTVNHLYQNLKNIKSVLIIAINAQSHSVDAPSPPPLVWGWRSLVSIWEKANRLPP